MENTNATLTPDQNIILEAKALRGKGEMIKALDLLTNLEKDTAESMRLEANCLVDLDCPHMAYRILDNYDNEPDLRSEIDNYKNLDVEARCWYKMARYDNAYLAIDRKMDLSEDKTRELPLLLWISTVGKSIDMAVENRKKIIVYGKNITDYNPYEIKSLTLFDKMFNLNQYRGNKELIDLCLEKLGPIDKPSEVDNGPWCFILSNIGYQDKNYIRAKFIEQLYYFESSIIDTIIPSKFLKMRQDVDQLYMMDKYDEARLDLYLSLRTTEEQMKYGTFPL